MSAKKRATMVLILALSIVYGIKSEGVSIDELNDDINEQMTTINNQYEQKEKLEEDISHLKDEMKQSEQDIKQLNKDIESLSSSNKELLKNIQLSSASDNVMSVLLTSDSMSDFVGKWQAINTLNKAEENRMKQLKEKREDVDVKRSSLKIKESQLNTKLNSLNAQTTQMELNIEQVKQELTDLELKQKRDNEKKSTESNVEKVEQEEPEQEESNQSKPTGEGRTMLMESTAYSYSEAGASHLTAMGLDLRSNPNVVAVDPNVIPMGSIVEVEGYGMAIASDTGGAIKGNIVDVHFNSVAECNAWGRRMVNVTVY